VAWLSLDVSDNELIQFLRGVAMALRVSDPRIGTALLDVVGSQIPPSPRMLLTVLVNDLVAADRNVILVLEDYHVVQDRAVHDAVAFLLEHRPALLRVVIVTREDPPLPLSRLRASDAVCELRAADLRFTLDEVTAFVQDVMGRRLSAASMAALSAQTEGWIGGLQLAVLSMPADVVAVPAFLAALARSQRDLLDYLTEEVLARQAPPVVAFLLRTAVLDRLSVPLCRAVMGEGDPDETRARLDQLERSNLFLVPLDDDGHWYRYHHLFADLLRARLRQMEPALFAELHRRASRWHEAQGFSREAIQHALAASDFDRAARLVKSNAMQSIVRGELQAVIDWCRRLPAALVQSEPHLGLAYTYALVLTNQPDTAEAHLQDVEQHLPSDAPAGDVTDVRGQIVLLRAILAVGRGDLERVAPLATEAYSLLPECDVEGRAFAQLGMAYAFRVSGDVTSVIERAVARVAKFVERLGHPALALVGLNLLGRLYMCQGRLRRAAMIFGRAEQAAGSQMSMGAPPYYFGRGELLRQWNELDEAHMLLQQGVEAAALNGFDAWVAAHGYESLARLRQTQGDSRGAMAAIDAFTVLARQREMGPQVLAHATAARAQLWLMQGNYVAASRWAATCGLTADDSVTYLREPEYCVLARVLIRKKSQAALTLLDRLLHDAEAKERMGSAIEILVLISLAWHALGNRTRAFSSLTRALALGEPEGYVRVFVDEGGPMASLLRRARMHGIAPEYSARLLGILENQTRDFEATAPSGSNSPAPGVPSLLRASPLIEPLTEREREVLRLLILAASNQEIARTLAISVGTVKQYASRIFAKLEVRTRTQAILRAKALHLD